MTVHDAWRDWMSYQKSKTMIYSMSIWGCWGKAKNLVILLFLHSMLLLFFQSLSMWCHVLMSQALLLSSGKFLFFSIILLASFRYLFLFVQAFLQISLIYCSSFKIPYFFSFWIIVFYYPFWCFFEKSYFLFFFVIPNKSFVWFFLQ